MLRISINFPQWGFLNFKSNFLTKTFQKEEHFQLSKILTAEQMPVLLATMPNFELWLVIYTVLRKKDTHSRFCLYLRGKKLIFSQNFQ